MQNLGAMEVDQPQRPPCVRVPERPSGDTVVGFHEDGLSDVELLEIICAEVQMKEERFVPQVEDLYES